MIQPIGIILKTQISNLLMEFGDYLFLFFSLDLIFFTGSYATPAPCGGAAPASCCGVLEEALEGGTAVGGRGASSWQRCSPPVAAAAWVLRRGSWPGHRVRRAPGRDSQPTRSLDRGRSRAPRALIAGNCHVGPCLVMQYFVYTDNHTRFQSTASLVQIGPEGVKSKSLVQR